jgi:ribosomal protein L21E
LLNILIFVVRICGHMSQEFTVGETVRLVAQPAYLKTAESRPMLRPPHLVRVGETGTIVDRRPGGWSVRFEKGDFLLDDGYLESVSNGSSSS